MGDQQIEHLPVVVLGGVVDGFAVVRVRAALEQQLHDPGVDPLAGAKQRRQLGPTVARQGERLRIRAERQQPLGDRDRPGAAHVVYRNERGGRDALDRCPAAVAERRHGGGGILREPALHRVGVAGDARGVDAGARHLGMAVEHAPHCCAITVVERLYEPLDLFDQRLLRLDQRLERRPVLDAGLARERVVDVGEAHARRHRGVVHRGQARQRGANARE